jgi:hypothetical protein
MSTFKLRDGFGLSENITATQGALPEYLQNLPDFSITNINFSKIANEDLTAPLITSLQVGVTFSELLKVGSPSAQLTVGATGNATLSAGCGAAPRRRRE